MEQHGNSNQLQLAKEKNSHVKDKVNEFNSMDYPLDDPAVVVLLADDISINQSLALSTIPILPVRLKRIVVFGIRIFA